MKKVLFALFSVCLLAVSCKKDKTDPAPVADKPYTNTNNGSNWIYEVITDPGAGQTSALDTVTVTGVDTTINSKNYRILNHTNGGNVHAYLNVTGNDYYQFQDIAAAGTAVEVIYLKDNAAVGTSWTQNINFDLGGIAVPVVLTSTITEKGGSRTVKGITYNDVIYVSTTLSSSGLPAGSIVSDIRNYYARNIGLIEAVYNIDVPLATLAIHNQTLLQFADPR